MKIEPDTVKGFQDFLPPESLKRQAIVRTIEKYFRLYGFLPIETPLIEFDELMKPENISQEQEDEAVSDRFRLKDRGNRNLGLRYEFTFQLARIFKMNPNIKLPFRRYQIGQVFRDEPISSTRFRQFTQCDADIIGSSDINSEAELLSMLSDILKDLGISAEIQINSRKLISSLIDSVEIPNTNAVIKELDKTGKISEDEIKVNLKKYTSSNQIITLFKLLEKDLDFYKENGFEGAEEVLNLISACKKYGIKVKFNQNLMRGLSYYTGNIFEVFSPEIKGSIAGGGRYDKVVGKFTNREIPAVGISFGLERLSQIAKPQISQIPKALLISIEEDNETIKLAKKLRAEKISCITAFGNTGKQLEYANSQAIPYVIFIGEDEVSSKKFKLKNMQSGEQKSLNEKQIIRALSKKKAK